MIGLILGTPAFGYGPDMNIFLKKILLHFGYLL
jgi:hypothetical protein